MDSVAEDTAAEDTAAECADVSSAEVYRDLKGGGVCPCSLPLSPPLFLRLTIGANHTPYDLVVVGGGIVGMATAREVALRHPTMKIAVVEKEKKLGGSSIPVLNGHIPVTPHESLGMRLHPVLLLWGLTPPLL